MQDRPPPLPADFFEQEKPPPLPADFFAPKPDPAKRIAQGKPKSQVKRENVLQTSNIGALIGAGFGAKPISPNQRKANELAKITGKTVAPATTVTGVKNPKPKAASGMDLANMANELQERMSKALKPIDPPDWVPNPLLGALGFVPGVKEVAKPSNVISGVALGGVDVAGDVAAFADRNSTREQQLGALANILVKTPLAVAGGGLALKGVSKGVQLAITKAQKVGSQRAMLAALKAAEKEGADLGQFATQVIPPKVETPSGLPPNLQPKPQPIPKAEVPKVEEPKVEPERTKTSVALRESDRYDMRPDEPDAESMVEWASKAKENDYGSQAGAAKILKRYRETQVEPDKSEIMGLGARLADIHTQLRGMSDGPARKALVDEARDLRSIRSTETARNLAARAALMHSDYSPGGIVASVEISTGKDITGKAAKAYEGLAKKYEEASKRVVDLEKELELSRKVKEPAPKATYWGKGTAAQRMAAAKKELGELTGKMSANVDPTIIKPIAKMVHAAVEITGGNIDLALKRVKDELKIGFGLEHTTDEIWDAYKGARPQRNVTEELIRKRRESARIAAAIRGKIRGETASAGTKIAQGLSKASTEIKMWNPVARVVDQLSNADEVVSTMLTSYIDRPIANAILKLGKSDAHYGMVRGRDRTKLIGRYISEVRADIAEAKGLSEGRWQGGGPAGHLAGIMDAPARAWHEITWAGERAQGLKKLYGDKFEELIDQIRDPELSGPLSLSEATRLHRQMKSYGDVQMLTNDNWLSRERGSAHARVDNLPAILQPAARFTVDMATQFSKVLVNVTDKNAQASNPFYALGRAIFEVLPNKKSKVDFEVRAKTAAQVIRRGGLGAGLAYGGYVYFSEGGRLPEVDGIPLGSSLVETIAKDGDRTGNFFQDEGELARIGRMSAAFMTGYRHAQIDNSSVSDKQKEKMKRDLLFAPITDTPIAGNVSRTVKMFDPNNPNSAQTFWAWMGGWFFPGGVAEWTRMQDKQEGTLGRRAEGPTQEIEKRLPDGVFFGKKIWESPRQKLPPKSVRRD